MNLNNILGRHQQIYKKIEAVAIENKIELKSFLPMRTVVSNKIKTIKLPELLPVKNLQLSNKKYDRIADIDYPKITIKEPDNNENNTIENLTDKIIFDRRQFGQDMNLED